MEKPSTKNPVRLNQDLEDLAITMSLEGKMLTEIWAKLGFTNVTAFFWYREKYTEFNEAINRARIQYCETIEDRVLHISELYGFKESKTQLEAYTRVLAWRVPAKYSQRIDMNINQTVSITHNLAKANDRMSELMRTVVPVMISDQAQDKTEA